MVRSPVVAAAFLLLLGAPGRAQTPPVPSGSMPPAPPRTIASPQNLAPAAPGLAASPAAPVAPLPPAAASPPAAAAVPGTPPPVGRVFCDQPVSFRVAPPDSMPAQYRQFVGVFSDAAWTPQLCAALVVENVTPDGTATIVYAFGPMDSTTPGPGGVLNGTGIIRDGELKFQNSDGSQYAFKPFYSDLEGHLLTSQGQAFEAIFKRTF